MNRWEYDYEVYEVETDDDWTLTLFRITDRPDPPIYRRNGPLKPIDRSKPPVLIMHGLGMDATSWLVRMGDMDDHDYEEDVNIPPPLPVAFALRDEGYDVWMGNNRGTRYSNQNSNHDPDADENPKKYRN